MSTYVGKFFTAVSSALEFNSATLSGAMDVVVIEDADGNRKSTPFHLRFGKLQLLKSRGISVDIDLNGNRTHLRMLLGAAGEAYFYNPPQSSCATPLNSSPDVQSYPSSSQPSLPTTLPPLPPSPLPSASIDFVPTLQFNPEDQLDRLPLPVRSSSTPYQAPTFEPPDLLLNPPLSRLTPSPSAIPANISSRSDPSTQSYDTLAYVSDSELEFSRADRPADPQLVFNGPLSPPVLPSHRPWTASSSKTVSHSRPPISPPPSSLPPPAFTTRTITPPEESSDLDNSALFGLPASPSPSRTRESSPDVTVPATINDVVGEEERKMEIRSIDGYDADDDADVSAGLQQHISRVLSAESNLDYPSFQTKDTDALDTVSSPPSDTDPPSDRDDLLTVSMCGSLLTPNMDEPQVMQLFERHKVTYEEFKFNPNLVFDPSVRFRIDNRIVELRIIAPMLVAALAFNARMDVDLLAQLTTPEITEEQKEASKSPETPRRFGWFGWSSSSPPIVGEPLLNEDEISALDAEKNEIPFASEENGAEIADGGNAHTESLADCKFDKPREAASMVSFKDVFDGVDVDGEEDETGTGKHGKTEAKSEEERIDGNKDDETEATNNDKVSDGPETSMYAEVDRDHLSLCPTPEQLNELDLKPGANSLRFVVESSAVELNCRIFLWPVHSKIVISDVDGTITRSDVLGHLLPAVGRDWSQVGVAGLYTEIEKNGYKILYLTARPIGQASQTRAFLHSVAQGSAKLPNGPVLMSPNRLMESFAREVIRRKPHEFKIAALREVRNLFSPDYNPFHAGFGNRDTDVISYRAVGLIPQRIFVVNPKGELVVMKAKYESAASYSTLQDLVESVFPDISGCSGHEKVKALVENATFNNWNYWRGQLPKLDIDKLLGIK